VTRDQPVSTNSGLKGLRVAAAAGLIPVLVAGVVGVSASAAPATVPVLGGVNVFVGSVSASVLVEVPHPVQLVDGGGMSPDAVDRGSGRYSGYILDPVDTRMPNTWVEDIWINMCRTAGCRAPEGPVPAGCLCETSVGSVEHMTLPAGRYRLILVADGAPVRVVLKLAGLTGRATFHPTGPARVRIVVPTPTQSYPAASPLLFAAGATHTFGARSGYIAMAVWKDELTMHEPNTISFTAQKGQPPSYLPLMPPYQAVFGQPSGTYANGEQATVVPGVPGVPVWRNAAYYYGGVFVPGENVAGLWSFGVSDDTVGPVLDAGATILWVDR
jgi:hypothetical protein